MASLPPTILTPANLPSTSLVPGAITPPTAFDNATPTIGVEIWPHNMGKIVFTSGIGGILSAEISKNIRNRQGGKFSIHITPGGPNGIEDFNTWSRILTLASLVIIYISRAGSNRIVMMGILGSVEESQIWQNDRVVRTIRLSGVDFTYYFSAFNYYTLAYLGVIPLSSTAAAGWVIGRFKNQFQGTPDSTAANWLTVMMGDNLGPSAQGVLENTYVTYQGSKILLRQIFAHWFEAFIETPITTYPLYVDLFSSEAEWLNRFLDFMPFPYYEFFITTANGDDFPGLIDAESGNSQAVPNLGLGFGKSPDVQISVPGYPSVWPTIIGRVNPLPWIVYPPKGGTASQISRSRWDSLPTYSLGQFSFIQSNVCYDSSEVYNFFGVNTLIASAIADSAGTGDANMYGIETFGAIIDFYSINTYGYRPNFMQLKWFSLPPKAIQKPGSGPINVPNAADVLLGKLASYYLPTPNMLYGSVSFPLWPDITPGNKFVYKPFKNSDDYEFYIEGVTHVYEFGGNSYTRLDISRGLKKVEYDDPDTMLGLHTDTEVRIDGEFTSRTDTAETPGAFHVFVGDLSNAKISAGPYLSAPPNILPNTMPVPTATGWPAGTSSAYDSTFVSGAAATTCGSSLDWRLVKALAITESSINQSAVSPDGKSVGIMQVNTTNSGYDPTQLKNNATYNINAGAQILCNKINGFPNLQEALAAYKGWANLGGYSNPLAKSEVDPVINLAIGAGVPNLP